MFFLDDDNISEAEIQVLFQTHPYLIEKNFLNKKIQSQYPLDSGFADIVIFLENEIVVIELKVVPLQIEHYLQLKGYLEDFNKMYNNSIKVRGILIGKRPKEDLKINFENEKFEIKILILNKDIPTQIKICENCRLANDISNTQCFNCFSEIFLNKK
ncbi:MAG: endonuclease NucS domain-containing protein [Candidatus Helarchaeota archaeon]